MSELQRRMQKRHLRRKAREFYRAMKESMALEQMLWKKVKQIDQRGDEMWIDGNYELQDGWGFRLLNEDEVLTGQTFPIEVAWIANLAREQPKSSKKRKRNSRAKRLNRCMPITQITAQNATCIQMPEEIAAQGELCTTNNILKAIVCFSLGVWFCSMISVLSP